MDPTLRFVRSLGPACLSAALLACSSDLVLPGDAAGPLAIAAVDGDGQVGTVGEALPEPLVVRVTGDGDGISGAQVAFVIVGAGAGGELIPDTATTNADGMAEARWVLGSNVGDQRVEARAVVAAGDAQPNTQFAASAAAGDADELSIVGGQDQTGLPGDELADPLAVRVVDRLGNPVGGATVEWEVESGRGRVSAESTKTGSNGETSVTWTLGFSLEQQEVSARAPDVSGARVTFEARLAPGTGGGGDGGGGGNGNGNGGGGSGDDDDD